MLRDSMVWALALCFAAAAVACSSSGDAGDQAGTDSGVTHEAAATDAGVEEAATARSETGPLPSSDAGSEAGDGGPRDAAVADSVAPMDAADVGEDADGEAGCFVSSVGVYGQCMTTAACAALGSQTSTPGYCPGPAGIECCTVTPNVADNPPVPAGWQLMPQSAVTPAMTAWAVAILQAPTTYPMFSTAMQTFGALNVLARVEWHPPDFQNSTVHRGVTLYEPQ